MNQEESIKEEQKKGRVEETLDNYSLHSDYKGENKIIIKSTILFVFLAIIIIWMISTL